MRRRVSPCPLCLPHPGLGSRLPARVCLAPQAQLDREQALAAMVCSLENKDACLMCGS